ncbi:MAG: hypothetical protein A2521_05030 [Deltaproteobacteria bacterium RIFOXYD12_FULL_57_12]|nr:MAG: hypothetical protein A2521_05030 [Deltaproteobacteria bacterium RIFOXYD12_FULL_57_12]
MNWLQIRRALLAFCFLPGCMLAGCTPAVYENMSLAAADKAFTSAQADPEVAGKAPLEWKLAEAAQARAAKALRDGADKAEIDHLAYLAQQQTLLAVEIAALRRAEQDVEAAKAEHELLLRNVRSAEVERALALAREQAAEAEKARQQVAAQKKEADLVRQLAGEKAAEAEKAQQEVAAAGEKIRRLEEQLAALQGRLAERGLVITLGDMLFETGASALKADAQPTVERLAAFLNEYPARRVQIDGFTDNVGAEEYNVTLSIERAEAVRTALSNKGVALERVLIQGYGEAFPVATNDTEEGRRRNRRVEVIISDDQGVVPERNP